MMNKIKKHKVKLIVALLVIIALVATSIVVVPKILKKDKKSANAEVKENTVQLTKMDLTKSVSATGTLESAKTKIVSASVQDVKIKSVKVAEGDTVKKGDTLVTFDVSDLKESLSDAKENYNDTVEECESNLESATEKVEEASDTYTSEKKAQKKKVAAAKKTYETAKANLKKAKTNEEKTKAKQSLSQAKEAYEKAKETQTSTNSKNKSGLKSAKQDLKKVQKENKKSLKEAKKTLEEAQETLEECKVTAPMSGTITAVGVEAGDTYSGGDMFEISDTTSFVVSTTVDEYDIGDVKKGQKVVILTDATGDTEIQGKITYVAVSTGSSSLSSSSGSGSSGSSGNSGGSSSSSSSSSSGYEVKIKVNDKNDALRIGMTAKCSIILEEAEDVYAVPYDAIHTNSNNENVIYVKDSSTGTKSEITVTKGMESDYYVEITGDSLSEDLQVIIPTDKTESSSSSSDDDSKSGLNFGMAGGMSDSGSHGGGNPGGMGGGPGGNH